MRHESGALSNLTASYASASDYYMMNVYGKEASAYYDMHQGLRMLKRGSPKPVDVPCAKNDTFVEELEEFAAAVRGNGTPEMSGESATISLAVVRASSTSGRLSGWNRVPCASCAPCHATGIRLRMAREWTAGPCGVWLSTRQIQYRRMNDLATVRRI